MLITQMKDKDAILSLITGKVFIINCHGCKEVSFHEQEAAILTEAGLLVLSGEELKLTRLDPDSGQVIVDGRILSLEYEQPAAKRSFFGRIRG